MAFLRWIAGVVGSLSGAIAVNGKMVRCSGNGCEVAIHIVSTFATKLGVVLGQKEDAGKSNEITAVPELLDALYLKGFLVRFDAMGYQKRIAKTLPTKGAVGLADRPTCKTVGHIDSTRTVSEKQSGLERRYYISIKLETFLLFSSSGKTQLVQTTPGKRVTAICKTMNCEPFDLRDIRRTCETMLAGMGISRDTRAELLSHGLSGVQSTHYDRHSYTDEKRAALVAWEQRLDDIAAGTTPAQNVVAMKQKRKAAA